MSKAKQPAWGYKQCTSCGQTEHRYYSARQCLSCGGELVTVEKPEAKEEKGATPLNEPTHVTVTSVSTDDAVEAIETLWEFAMAYCEKYRPMGVEEIRGAKNTLTKLWLERDALQAEVHRLQERERQLKEGERGMSEPTIAHKLIEAAAAIIGRASILKGSQDMAYGLEEIKAQAFIIAELASELEKGERKALSSLQSINLCDTGQRNGTIQ